MPYKTPPIDKQFPVNRPHTPHHIKHPNGYLGPLLKKVLRQNYRIQDPETQKIKKIAGAKGLMQVLVWQGLQGEVPAIKEIMDRVDGKVKEQVEHSGETYVNINIIKPKD